MATVTKKELSDRIADSLLEKRVQVKAIIQRFLDEMVVELSKGNRLEFRDFGVFEVRTRKPRMAQNPRTLERVPVPVKSTVKFKIGRLMRDRVQKGATESPSPGRAKASRAVESPAATPPPAV